jgi:hypothetical protein
MAPRVAISLAAMDTSKGSTAVVFALGGTLAFVGPTLGHFYAERYRSPGLILRVGALGVGMAGALVANAECRDSEPCAFLAESRTQRLLLTAVVTGLPDNHDIGVAVRDPMPLRVARFRVTNERRINSRQLSLRSRGLFERSPSNT